jgi:hypothetical protein
VSPGRWSGLVFFAQAALKPQGSRNSTRLMHQLLRRDDITSGLDDGLDAMLAYGIGQ